MILLITSALINALFLLGAAVLVVFLIYGAFYETADVSKENIPVKKPEMSIVSPPEPENTDIPPIYVNKCLLPLNNILEDVEYKRNKNRETIDEYKVLADIYKGRTDRNEESVKYKVNDSEFIEDLRRDDSLVEFEIVAKMVNSDMELDYDLYCESPPDSVQSDCEEDTQPLPISLQSVPHGYIVNLTLYLTDHQWNTLLFLDVKTIQCLVCDIYCDLDSCSEHIKTNGHKKSLDRHPPLMRFDLSITRKIHKNYHCAVCNEIFPIAGNAVHFSSSMHEGNFVFAINKASDLNYDTQEPKKEKKTEFDYNYEYINFQNNYEDFDYDFEPPQPGVSYANMAKVPKVHTQQYILKDLGNKKVRVRFDSWHMVICPQLNKFYCMVCKLFDHVRLKTVHCTTAEHLRKLELCKVVEVYEEYFIRQVDEKLYHCGHCNNLQPINLMSDHVETVHPRKPRTMSENQQKTPIKNKESGKENINTTNIKNLFGNRTVKNNVPQNGETKPSVKKEGQQIGGIKPIYKNDGPQIDGIKPIFKNDDPQYGGIKQNVKNDGHKYGEIKPNIKNDVSQIGGLKPIFKNDKPQYGGIEQNDGTQSGGIKPSVKNNEPQIDGIKPSVKNNEPQIGGIKPSVKNDGPQYGGIKPNIKNEGPLNGAQMFTKMAGIYETTTIYPFGNKLTIPLISYNVMTKRSNDFYCRLCIISCTEAVVKNHMYEMRHIEMLQRTPFIGPFNCHLIRAIRDSLHCAICNISLPVNKIYNHIDEQQHLDLLKKAMSITDPILQQNQANAVPNNIVDIESPNAPVPINQTVLKNVKEIIPIDDKIQETRIGSYSKNDKISYTKDHKFTEFKKPDTKMEDSKNLDNTFDSVDSDYFSFDTEEYVYLKLKNTYIKITNSSYNTLVQIGDGSRYCFVCASQVDYVVLQKHVESRGHVENLEKYWFLEKYENHLLRQIYLMYHCGVCNVIITKKEVKAHLEWPTHYLQNENSIKNIKKQRKNDIKGGIKQIVVSTQKENIFVNEKETKIKICLNYTITKTAQPKKRKFKIVIVRENVFKISWEAWHGVCKIKNGFKCILCQIELGSPEIDVHCASEWHLLGLDKPFETQHGSALIRKVNEITLNCLLCNTEVSNKEDLVTEHISGKKHVKNYEQVLKDSSTYNAYTDCDEDVFTV